MERRVVSKTYAGEALIAGRGEDETQPSCDEFLLFVSDICFSSLKVFCFFFLACKNDSVKATNKKLLNIHFFLDVKTPRLPAFEKSDDTCNMM